MNVFAAATTRHRHRRAAQATTAPVMMMAASSTVPVTHMSSAMSVIVIAASSAPRAPWPAAAARTLHRGAEPRIHLDQPLACVLAHDLVAGLVRAAHERVGAAVEIARRTAAPPLAVVGHGYAKVSGLDLRRYAGLTDK